MKQLSKPLRALICEDGSPGPLAGRVPLLNPVLIHISSLTVTNLVLDLISFKVGTLDHLRDGITSVSAETEGVWIKTGICRMEKLDSACQERAPLNTDSSCSVADDDRQGRLDDCFRSSCSLR